MVNISANGKELAKQDDVDLLSGKKHLNVSDANDMTTSGFHYIDNHDGRHDYPVQSWGNMIISNGENQRIVQIFYPDNGTNPWFRIFEGHYWQDWQQFAAMRDISKLEQEISDLKKQIGGVKAHYRPLPYLKEVA